MKAYKGFNKNLQCQPDTAKPPFQYEIGKTYEESEAKLCDSGFHACEYPLDCFRYYDPANGRFCEVELDGVDKRKDDDSKVCGTKIKINAEIGIPGLVKAAIEYVTAKAKPSNRHHTTGYGSANSATGDWSVNSATGNWSANSATGNWSANSATGYGSANSATGNWSANSATGDWSANSATGYGSANSATGYGSANSATGYGSANSATGYGSVNVSTGSYSSNDGAGQRNISVGWGKVNKCKGSVGSFIVLSEWGEWDGEKNPFIAAKMVEIDGETYKADTFYTLKDGEIVEAE